MAQQETTVARPYAQAAFDLAREAKSLAGWADGLALVDALMRDSRVMTLVQSPRVGAEQKADLMIEICGDGLDQQQRNFVRLLIERDRIVLIAFICEQFEALRAAHEGRLTAHLTAAQPIDQPIADRLASALSKRLSLTVSLETEIDETLIGGAVIRAGDLVIDGSVRGRLQRLTGALSR